MICSIIATTIIIPIISTTISTSTTTNTSATTNAIASTTSQYNHDVRAIFVVEDLNLPIFLVVLENVSASLFSLLLLILPKSIKFEFVVCIEISIPSHLNF